MTVTPRKYRFSRSGRLANTTSITARKTAEPSSAESLSPMIIAIEPSAVAVRQRTRIHSFSVRTAITKLTGSVTQMKLASIFLLPMVEKNSIYTLG